MSKLNKLALVALIFNILGYLPKIGHVFSLVGFIVGVLPIVTGKQIGRAHV